MQTRLSMGKFAACCVLVILISAPFAMAGGQCPPGYGYGGYYGNSFGWQNNGIRPPMYPAMSGYYYDVRDTRTYAAQGYNVPVTVPAAPITRTYNYGWGIPSSRLSPIGGYSRWNPEVPFTQNGGRLPAMYPVIYQPTDTTQFGVYYSYVPTWQPR